MREPRIERAEKWDVVDIVFTGTQGAPNPFDVEWAAEFNGPSGQNVTVPGFYNGDDSWVIRFSPSEEGEWRYRTASDMPQLDGQQGSVVCRPNTKPHIHGPLTIDKNNPRHFVYEDGTRYFLIGFELDWLFALDLGSRRLDKTRQIVDEVSARGFNHIVMNVYASDVGWPTEGRNTPHDYSRPAQTIFGGTNERPDHSTLNVDFFKHLDRVVAYLQTRQLVAHLMIYVWNKFVNWPEMGTRDDDRYLNYVVARYQAFSNVVWDVSKEALTYDYCGQDYITNRARRIRERDGHKRLLTVHDDAYCRNNPAEVDFHSIQAWRSDLYSHMLDLHKNLSMPLLNIEHGGYEKGPYRTFIGDYQDPVACLERNYQCIFAGAYSTYYWQCCSWNIVVPEVSSLDTDTKPRWDLFRYMQQFFSAIPYHELVPAREGISSGMLLMKPDRGLYVIFKPTGSCAFHFTPCEDTKRYGVEWFNPLTGERKNVGIRERIHFREFESPWGEAMAILTATPV